MEYFTQKELKNLIIYDPDTGILQRRVTYEGESSLVVFGTITSKGHIVVTIKGKTYSAARLAWLYVTGEKVPDDMTISYRNLNRSDIRFDNLFITSHARNKSGAGRVKRSNKQRSNRPTCVHRNRDGLFYIKLTINLKRYKSKCFETVDQAYSLYKSITEEYRTKGTFDTTHLIRGGW